MSVVINILAFLFVFTLIVFVHELGHYLVARWNGVKVDVFSIGFGTELLGYTSKSGTRWKLSAIPLGGYVKMYGDANVASTGPADLNEEQKKNWNLTLHSKGPWQRASVAVAGPLGNYVFAILIFACLFVVMGKPFTLPVVTTIMPESPAEKAGLKPKDKVLEINNNPVESFEDFTEIVRKNPATELKLKIEREGQKQELPVTPALIETKDIFGNVSKIGQIGVQSAEITWKKVNPFEAVGVAFAQTWKITSESLQGLWEMIIGKRSAEGLGGPIRIFQMSGKVAELGIATLISFTALLSISLGLLNLFPIPALDGGHIVFCVIEGIRGKPVSERIQEYVTIVGVVALLALMIFATWNDLKQLRIFEWVAGLFG